MKIAVRFLILAVLLTGAHGQSGKPEDVPKAFQKIYAEYLKLTGARMHFDRAEPSSKDGNAAAFEAWLAHYNLREFVRVGREKFPAEMAATEKGFPLEGKLMRFAVGMMVSKYSSFPAFAQDTRLELCCRKQMALVTPLLPSAPAPTAPTPAPGPAPTPAPAASGFASAGRAYTVLDLNAVAGEAMLRAVKAGQRTERRAAATNALRGLGAAITVMGVVGKRGNTLEYETPETRARWTPYLHFTSEPDEEQVERRAGQMVAVRCQPLKLDTFIELRNCRFAGTGAGWQAMNLPLPVNAVVRKAVPPEQLLAGPGEGLPANEVEGVYLKSAMRTGVGGMLLMTFEPFLLLKDGSYYDEPVHAPEAFAYRRSREREPQEWGKFTWTKKDEGKLVWDASNDEEDDREDEITGIHKLIPGGKGQKLSGRLSHTSGAGNTAMGGNTSIISERAFTFTPAGRFQRDGFTGGSSGGDYGSGGPTVVFSNQKASMQGRYEVDGYSIVLTYDSGKVERLLFAAQDQDFGFLCIGGTMYVKR
jgi:hypothetical protein